MATIEAEAFPCDVGDAGDVEALAAAVQKRFGTVDVLINNAGQFVPDALLSMSTETWDGVISANLRSVFLVTRAFAPAMVARGRGDIFIMASVAGIRAFPAGGAYVAAKHGVLGLARAFREELKASGVRVTAVLPGATMSPSWDGSGVLGGADDARRGCGAERFSTPTASAAAPWSRRSSCDHSSAICERGSNSEQAMLFRPILEAALELREGFDDEQDRLHVPDVVFLPRNVLRHERPLFDGVRQAVLHLAVG